jgi:hypothetical protein
VSDLGHLDVLHSVTARFHRLVDLLEALVPSQALQSVKTIPKNRVKLSSLV